MQPFLEQKREQLADLCREYRVKRLSVFGSAVRDDFDPQHSDVDLLVEFEPLNEGSYTARYYGLEQDLVQALQRDVDLIVEGSIRNSHIREQVAAQKEPLFAA